MWRLLKRVSQLLVIGFGFWAGVSGMIAPTVAFAGMIVAYLGVEGFESFLALVGSEGLSVQIEAQGEGDEEEGEQTHFRTDGGAIVDRLRRR